MLHRKLNLHNQMHKLSRWNFIKTGLLIAVLAVSFLIDRTYFFYPPSLAPAWNDVWVDIIGLLAGIDLILCGVLDIHVDLLVKLGLSVSAAFLTALLVAESFHVLGIGYVRFYPAIIFEIYAIINLMQIAYEYQPQKNG
ncbi:hypothetical protein [Lactobacillus helveticus]|uniref:hypothetical protein n=1 Tax=Lactobacillus helveticus TaxID=1587 RepID=UPI001562186E|nr:hypothetical protein [Lactobacillus helveticus]NRO88860.1 hypothetical protein [Lactobacillus helveticus]